MAARPSTVQETPLADSMFLYASHVFLKSYDAKTFASTVRALCVEATDIIGR